MAKTLREVQPGATAVKVTGYSCPACSTDVPLVSYTLPKDVATWTHPQAPEMEYCGHYCEVCGFSGATERKVGLTNDNRLTRYSRSVSND